MFRMFVRDLKKTESNEVVAEIEWKNCDSSEGDDDVCNVLGHVANNTLHFVEAQDTVPSEIEEKILDHLNNKWNGDYGDFCYYGISRDDYARLFYLYWITRCDFYRLDKEIEAIMGTGDDADVVFENITGIDTTDLTEHDRSYLIQVGLDYEKKNDFECEYMGKMKYIGRTNDAHLIFLNDDNEMLETGLSLLKDEMMVGQQYDILGLEGFLTMYCRVALPEDQR